MKHFKIAMVQMRVAPGEPEKNLRHATEMITRAAQTGAELALLPECLDLGWTSGQASTLTKAQCKATLNILKRAAKDRGIWLVAGLTQRKSGRLYNRAVLISDKGKLVGSHRKISLVPGVEDSLYSPGYRTEVFNTPLGRLAIPVCADNLMPSIAIGETLGLMGAEVILSPCSWAVPKESLGQPYGGEWYEPYTHLSKRFGMFVIGVSNVGQVIGGAWDGWQVIGNSIAMSPGGNIIKVLPYGADAETIDTVDV